MTNLGDGLDVPFEEGPPGQTVDLGHAHVAGGLVVMASVVPVAGEAKPALIWRFTSPLGQFYPPVVLVLDEDQAIKTTALVDQAVKAAVRAAKEAS